MGVATITQMSNRIASLMEDRLGASGRDLSEKLKRGGRKLPHRVRVAAGILAEASEMAKNPKLQVRLDEAKVAEAYDLCLRHLGPMTRRAGGKAYLTSFGASAAFSTLVVAAGFIAFLVWRGFV